MIHIISIVKPTTKKQIRLSKLVIIFLKIRENSEFVIFFSLKNVLKLWLTLIWMMMSWMVVMVSHNIIVRLWGCCVVVQIRGCRSGLTASQLCYVTASPPSSSPSFTLIWWKKNNKQTNNVWEVVLIIQKIVKIGNSEFRIRFS